MTDRNPRVKLPDSEARCTPSGICHAVAKCARALAPMPATGAVVVDGWAENIQARGLSPTAIVSCRRYVVPQYVSKTADATDPVPTKECKAFKEYARLQAMRQKAPWIMGEVVLDVILHPKAKKDGTASAVRIDLSNCLKAAEDALQGVCYENDRQVIGVHLRLSEEPVPSGAMRVMVRPA